MRRAMRGIAFLMKVFVALAFAAASGARADEIEVGAAALRATEEGLVLSADFAFELNPRLGEVVANGVPLYFLVEFEVSRPRWYWFDEKTAASHLQLRLSYHALSRQYRLSSGPLQQNFPSLREALDVLRRVRNWLVAERSVLHPDTNYEAVLRMRLDVSLLPKPFQLSALTSRELNLESPWKRFTFRVPALPPAPAESREPNEAPAR